MKKVVALLLALLMVMALCGCGDKQEVEPDSSTPTSFENMYGVSYEGPGTIAQESGNISKFEDMDFNGLWIEKSSGATLDFFDDPNGKAIKRTSADGRSSSTNFGWVLDGDCIKFPYRDDIIILVEQSNDSIQLKYNDGTYIREVDYYTATNTLQLGETAETDSVVFTLNQVSFVDEVSPTTLTPSDSGGLGTSPDMCFAYLTFSLKNIGKSDCNVGEDLDFTVDYDDGYKFEMKGDKYSYLGIANTTINRKITGGASSGSLISLSPLTSEDLIVLIPCADVISSDATSPLKVFVSLPTSQGHQVFIYEIQ